MTDAYGRTIDYLRLSVTDRCNLRCRYCMPEDLPSLPHESILRYEEFLRVCAAAAGLGVKHYKITGGEPLVRKGCPGFIRALKTLPGVEHVTLTTNGVLLSDALDDLAEAGIDGINISLDTLDPAQYARITGRDAFDRVMAGLRAALDRGLQVKVNCVPLADTGLEGLLALAALAERYPLDVRFIEMMPIGSGRDFTPVDPEVLRSALAGAYPGLAPSEERRGFGPARYCTAPGLRGSLGFIDAVSHNFCAGCNRVRLTSEGFLKLCLCYGDGVDLRALLRGGASEEVLAEAIRQAILEKPARHSFGAEPPPEQRGMSQIGG